MADSIQIIPLDQNPREVRRFLRVAGELYRHDPLWVIPPLRELEKVLTRRNPFFQHASMQLWVAVRHGRDVGRIAAIEDHAYNAYQNECTAFFGFFECIRDAVTSWALFEAAVQWARERGLTRLMGPMNPSSNDECGTLIDGFDRPPALMMSYNPAYYVELVEAAGFRKAKDLLAFHIDLRNSPIEKFERIARRFERPDQKFTVRPILKRTLGQDLAKLKDIYNRAWERNWGFVPLTDAEIDALADRLVPLLEEGLAWIAEAADEPAAFMLAVPDYYEALRWLRGRWLTPGLVRALPYFLGWRRPEMVRLIALGIKQPYRGRGLEAIMFARGLQHAARVGYRACEASWTLEDNVPVQRLIELFGGRRYKTYRLYERSVVDTPAGRGASLGLSAPDFSNRA